MPLPVEPGREGAAGSAAPGRPNRRNRVAKACRYDAGGGRAAGRLLIRLMRSGGLLLALVGLSVMSACGLRPHPVASPAEDAEELAIPKPTESSSLACIQHPSIDAWERRLRSRPYRDDTRETLRRAVPYLPLLRRIMQESGVPPDLALLPAVESSFYPDARGRSDDRGLWQLRRGTARRFGLVVSKQRDDRLHPDHSTRAAARYLRFLHARFRDWPTALAAYNAGENRIQRARTRARQPDGSFWDLTASGQLPSYSRDYVARFLAVVRLSEGVKGCTQVLPLPVVQNPRPARRSVL